MTEREAKGEEFYCLNCGIKLQFEEDSNYISTCESCNWRNELNDTAAIETIAIKTKRFEDYSYQIAYPLLEKSLMQYLPEQLQIAVKTYLREPKAFTTKMYQNIYHNIFTKDISKLSKRIEILTARLEFAQFFHTTFLTRQ